MTRLEPSPSKVMDSEILEKEAKEQEVDQGSSCNGTKIEEAKQRAVVSRMDKNSLDEFFKKKAILKRE
ncbi:hypothetical protein ACH5RR_015420 [Cinchona calisaya]|uniref:Uncharacterized protein n=1 Tax=Cinchona calisaya TaxID=153742 RepID=A0ABD2ZT32_9GENT